MSKFYFTEEQDVRVDEIIENKVEENNIVEDSAIENKEIEESFKDEVQIKTHTLEDENLEIKYFWVRTL